MKAEKFAPLVIIGIIGLAALPFVINGSKSTQQESALSATSEINPEVPLFELPTPAGEKIALKELLGKNKAILINFWFAACPGCREEFPHLAHIYAKYKNKGFDIVAVNSDDDAKTINDFLEKERIEIPAVMGVKTSTMEDYKVRSYPTNILLDRTGKVILRMEGFNEGQIEEAIQRLILQP